MTRSRVLIKDAPAHSAAPAAGVAGNGRADQGGGGADGPLTCVIGTCGSAGASTVALLLAWKAAQHQRPVLCCDAAGPTADLARLAGVTSSRSLAETAVVLDRGRLGANGLFATAAGEVRVIASDGRIEPDATGVGSLLSLARQAHACCVVDCGTLSTAASLGAYEQATHVAWVVGATAVGKERAERTLDAVRRHPTARELVVARGCDPALGRVKARELQRLAEKRHSPLIALPHVEKLALPCGSEQALEECHTGLQELCTLTLGARAR